jgi:hypothetical protein
MSATGIKDIPALILMGSLFASSILIQSSYDMAVATSYQAASLSSAGTTISTTSNFRINSQNCPGEVAIYVHGWTPTNKSKTIEEAERVGMSIKNSEYARNITVLRFSWDSQTGLEGWRQAIDNANRDGDELANWTLTFKNACPNDNVRIIAHSLGSRVVLSALEKLHTNASYPEWNTHNFTIASVHLLGAAVDNEEVSKNLSDTGGSRYDDQIVYGQAIEEEVSYFYNLFNREDDRLEPAFSDPELQPVYYPYYENDTALGNSGKQSGIAAPQNYIDTSIQDQILAIDDADGDGSCDLINYMPPYNCTVSNVIAGDNHFGYMGFRDPENRGSLADDGAMDAVVSDWTTGTP